MFEEGTDLGRAQLLGMAFAVEHDEPPDPIDVGLAQGGHVAAAPQGIGELIEKARGWS
jgi:hypothetical protein